MLNLFIFKFYVSKGKNTMYMYYVFTWLIFGQFLSVNAFIIITRKEIKFEKIILFII